MNMNQISEILKEKQQLTVSSTVDSYKDINNTVNGDPVKEEYRNLEKKTDDLLNELQGNPEFVADKLARELDDLKSKKYYLILAKNTDVQVLLEALSCTKLADSEGKIKWKKWAYFKGILKKMNVRITFTK